MELITEGNSEETYTVTRVRKDKIWPEEVKKDYRLSNEDDLIEAQKIAHAYAKDYYQKDVSFDIFQELGERICYDFQFDNKGAGRNTIGGQLDNSSVKNRDCKLPVLLLALAVNDLNPQIQTNIVYSEENFAHPYVGMQIGEQIKFGHFVNARPEDLNQRTRFKFTKDEKTKDLEGNTSISVKADIDGLRRMDELFLKAL